MRIIIIGCEYVGKSTLIQELMKWGPEHGFPLHLDDHFSIPDTQTLLQKSDQEVQMNFSQTMKERFQRFQIAYHLILLNKLEHMILGGFHIEETIYGPRYYYPDMYRPPELPRMYELEMPDDMILRLRTASAEVIEKRMHEEPHTHPLVSTDDIQPVLDQFRQEYMSSWIKRKFEMDTSNLAPKDILEVFLDACTPHLSARDLLIKMNRS